MSAEYSELRAVVEAEKRRVDDLKSQVDSLKTTAKIIAVVATIFGLGGAYGAFAVRSAEKQLEGLRLGIADASNAVHVLAPKALEQHAPIVLSNILQRRDITGSLSRMEKEALAAQMATASLNQHLLAYHHEMQELAEAATLFEIAAEHATALLHRETSSGDAPLLQLHLKDVLRYEAQLKRPRSQLPGDYWLINSNLATLVTTMRPGRERDTLDSLVAQLGQLLQP